MDEERTGTDMVRRGQYLLRLTNYGSALSKFANVLFTSELQRILDTQRIPITAICLHPGIILTGILVVARDGAILTIYSDGADTLFKSYPPLLQSFCYFLAALFFISVTQGSYTTLFAATSPEIRLYPSAYKGGYLLPYGKPTDTTDQGRDRQLARNLWALSEKIVNQSGSK